MAVVDVSAGRGFGKGDGLRISCPHCGTSNASLSQLHQPIDGAAGKGSWVLRCGACEGHIYLDLVVLDENRYAIKSVFPFAASVTGIDHAPDGVRAALQEAATCAATQALTAGALVCRRALQLIARDKGIKGDLYVAIPKLPITDLLKQAAHAVRLIGNEGAHPDPIDWHVVTVEDLSQIIELTRKIAIQVYEEPLEIQNLLNRAQNLHGHPASP